MRVKLQIGVQDSELTTDIIQRAVESAGALCPDHQSASVTTGRHPPTSSGSDAGVSINLSGVEGVPAQEVMDIYGEEWELNTGATISVDSVQISSE